MPPLNEDRIHISFVCSGNICRSPYAEAFLRKTARSEGWADKILVSSAGTLGICDAPASSITISLATEDGLNLLTHRSRALTDEYLNSCDLILGMAGEHVALLRRMMPVIADRVFLMTNYPNTDLDADDIPDPIGQDEETFVVVHQAIIDSMLPLLSELRKVLGVKD